MLGELINDEEILRQAREVATTGHDSGFIRAVILETLRLHPPVAFLTGRLLIDREVGGVIIPKGSTIKADIYHALCGDSSTFEDALEFRPDRFFQNGVWNQSNVDKVDILFASAHDLGRRRCPGQDNALSLLTSMLVTILQHSTVICEKPVKWDRRNFQLMEKPETILISSFKASMQARESYRPNPVVAAYPTTGDSHVGGTFERVDRVLMQICEPLIGSDIDVDVPIVSHGGLSSILSIQFRDQVEKKFDFKVDVTELMSTLTLRTL